MQEEEAAPSTNRLGWRIIFLAGVPSLRTISSCFFMWKRGRKPKCGGICDVAGTVGHTVRLAIQLLLQFVHVSQAERLSLRLLTYPQPQTEREELDLKTWAAASSHQGPQRIGSLQPEPYILRSRKDLIAFAPSGAEGCDWHILIIQAVCCV